MRRARVRGERKKGETYRAVMKWPRKAAPRVSSRAMWGMVGIWDAMAGTGGGPAHGRDGEGGEEEGVGSESMGRPKESTVEGLAYINPR